MSKLLELMKIRGSTSQVKKQLQLKQRIFCKARFESLLRYFEQLEQTLAMFEIYTEDTVIAESHIIETKKE